MKMKSASELHEISKKQTPIIVNKVLDGVKEHCIYRCIQEANGGSTYYSIYLKQARRFVREVLLEECIKLVKEFEDNGYKVSIDDSGDGYYIDFIITVSWDGKVKTREKATFHNNKHLYDTDSGVISIEDLEEWDDEED